MNDNHPMRPPDQNGLKRTPNLGWAFIFDYISCFGCPTGGDTLPQVPGADATT